MSKVIPRARITKPSSTTASQSSPTSQNTTPAVSSPPIAKEETTTITGVNSSSSQPSNVVTPSSSTNTSTTPEKRGNPSTTSRIKTSTNPPSQLQQPKEPVHSKTSSLDDDLQFLYSSAGFSLSKEQQAKFNRYSKRMVLKRKLEQFRLIAFVKQIFNNYVNPITLCIIYHRQNFGEYVMALFDDRDKLTDLYPLTNDKASVTICPNPITFTDLCLQINCNNDEEESKTFYFQCESEMQLLSIMSAFQKALLYNGQDAKYNKPSFHSLVSTYSQKKPKNGQQKTPIPFSWCDQYLARYSSNEDLDLKKTKNPLLNKLLGDDSSNDSTCLSSSPYGSLKYVSSSRGRFDEQDNHGGLASRHKTSYMSDHDDDDENNEEQIDSQHVDTYFQKTILPKTTTTHIVETRTYPQRNHEVTSVAHHDEPTTTSPPITRKHGSNHHHETPTNTSMEEQDDTPKVTLSKISLLSSANVMHESSSPSSPLTPNNNGEDSNRTTPSQESSPTTTTSGSKKVIKRVVKRVPAKSGSATTTTEE